MKTRSKLISAFFQHQIVISPPSFVFHKHSTSISERDSSSAKAFGDALAMDIAVSYGRRSLLVLHKEWQWTRTTQPDSDALAVNSLGIRGTEELSLYCKLQVAREDHRKEQTQIQRIRVNIVAMWTVASHWQSQKRQPECYCRYFKTR